MTQDQLEELLYSAFSKAFQMEEVSWRKLAEFSYSTVFQKNTVVKAQGVTEKNIYFIVQGSVGSFAHKGDKRVCVDLCYENEFTGDYSSLLSGKPGITETIALEKCLLLVIPFKKLIDFYKTLPPFIMEKAGRISAEFLYILKCEQLLDLQTLTAGERLDKLIATKPQVLQRTALQHIASYLGITKESLSRLRNKK